MSLRRNNKPSPPEVMTWMKAVPVLVISFVFDALRFAFEQFWLVGPAVAAALCTAGINATVSEWSLGLLGAKTAAAVCSTAAGIGGFFAAPALTAFGVVMAMAVGLFGWLTVGFILKMTNSRIFTDHPGHTVWLVASLLVSEVPLIGSIPAFTVTVAKLYYTQIKNDRKALQKYEKENAAAQLQERRQQAAELVYAQNIRMNEIAAIDTAQYEQAVQDEEEIPGELRRAA